MCTATDKLIQEQEYMTKESSWKLEPQVVLGNQKELIVAGIRAGYSNF